MIKNSDPAKIFLFDYLRSIGILLPFTTITNGEVKTYEVEEILALN